MCKWHGGTYEGNVPILLAHADGRGRTYAYVDPCIRPLVQALNSAGIQTINSCCGHGVRPGWIALEDGRQILVAKDFDEMRKMDNMFPSLIEGKSDE